MGARLIAPRASAITPNAAGILMISSLIERRLVEPFSASYPGAINIAA
jgi:hypothetical protein